LVFVGITGLDSTGDAPKSLRFSYRGSAWDLLAVHISNAFLSILTLGFYSFWGKANLRRYVMGETEVAGDHFAYHGTGRELMGGWARALFIVGGPIVLAVLIGDALKIHLTKQVGELLLYCYVGLLMPMATVGSWRYRLSRISWRAIRFSFRGRTLGLARIWIKGILLSICTLGLYYPYFVAEHRRYLVNNSYFGSKRFEFDGTGGELLGEYFLALILTPCTFGLYLLWFSAWKQRYFMEHTHFETARFRSTVTGSGLLSLYFTNALLLICTLGLAYPFVKTRTLRFHAENTFVDGPVDLDSVVQDIRAATTTGEGLSTMLEDDGGLLDMELGF
jgi:uncharacterized membrane protein YjgN (DUF898 family)